MAPYPHSNFEEGDRGGVAGQDDAEVPDGAEVINRVDVDGDAVAIGGDL